MTLVAYVNSPTDVTESYVEEFVSGTHFEDYNNCCHQLAEYGKSSVVSISSIVWLTFYNLDANDEKNEVAQKSAEFIDERIGIINQELGTAETERRFQATLRIDRFDQRCRHESWRRVRNMNS